MNSTDRLADVHADHPIADVRCSLPRPHPVTGLIGAVGIRLGAFGCFAQPLPAPDARLGEAVEAGQRLAGVALEAGKPFGLFLDPAVTIDLLRHLFDLGALFQLLLQLGPRNAGVVESLP